MDPHGVSFKALSPSAAGRHEADEEETPKRALASKEAVGLKESQGLYTHFAEQISGIEFPFTEPLTP